MKIKKIISILLVMVLTFSLAACGGSEDTTSSTSTGTEASDEKVSESSSSSSEIEPVTLKFNCVKTANDPEYEWWTQFCADIEEQSGGTLNVEIYPSETLGKAVDMLEGASKGSTVLQDCDASFLADYVPDFSVFMAPYLIQEPEQIQELWESEVGQRLSGELEDKGLKLVTYVYFGTRNLISNKEVTSRADTADLKIRCASTKMWNEVVRVLGGSPTNTAWSEVYTSLSQGVADGAESPYALLYSAKLYEPVKHLSLTEHLVAATAIVMSADVYNSLPAEAQAAIDEVGHSYPPQAIKNVKAVEDEYRQKLVDEGVIIHEVDKTAFIEAAKETPEYFPEWSEGLYQEVLETLGND